jgi:hypothetical protein
MEFIKNLLTDFKEKLCPGTRVRDLREQLRVGFNESLKVKELEIQDLKNEIIQLKKDRKCCFCGDTSDKDLKVFHQKLWRLTGYPSYFYCSRGNCINHYVAQLESL